jgi:hypothetical protein
MFQTNFREIQSTHIMFYNFFSENLAIREIIWKYVVEPDRPQITAQHGVCTLHAG